MKVQNDHRSLPGTALDSSRPLLRIPRPAAGMRLARARRRRGPRTVLALYGQEQPDVALQRAVTHTHALDAPIHVLRVLPGLSRLRALFSPADAGARASRLVQRSRCAARSTRAWLREAPEATGTIEQVTISHGDFVEQTAVYAASVDAELIITAADPGRATGKLATRLARASRLPVFVVRESAGAGAIVAGTDLEYPDYPVLSKAAEVSGRLQASLVAVHNVKPVLVTSTDMFWVTGHLPRSGALGVRSEQLARAATHLPVEVRTVVHDEISDADAILKEARACDADVVVVGTRQRGWCGALADPSVAAQVVQNAPHSVLVLPLDARH